MSSMTGRPIYMEDYDKEPQPQSYTIHRCRLWLLTGLRWRRGVEGGVSPQLGEDFPVQFCQIIDATGQLGLVDGATL